MKNSTPPNIQRRGHHPKSSAWWADQFQRELQRDWTITWDCGVLLPEADKERVAASIAEFQRGKSSEARSYLGKSARFGARVNDVAFHVMSQLFVATGNAHADLLLRFMQRTGIPKRETSSLDGVFRWLLRLSDLGWTSRMIIIAELIAQEYYSCLRAATTHPILTRICDRIASEDATHIRFQVERIARIEATQYEITTRLRDAIQSVLIRTTACAVYFGHRRVLSVRLTFREFFTRVITRNRRAVAAMRALRVVAVSPTPPRPTRLPANSLT